MIPMSYDLMCSFFRSIGRFEMGETVRNTHTSLGLAWMDGVLFQCDQSVL